MLLQFPSSSEKKKYSYTFNENQWVHVIPKTHESPRQVEYIQDCVPYTQLHVENVRVQRK